MMMHHPFSKSEILSFCYTALPEFITLTGGIPFSGRDILLIANLVPCFGTSFTKEPQHHCLFLHFILFSQVAISFTAPTSRKKTKRRSPQFSSLSNNMQGSVDFLLQRLWERGSDNQSVWHRPLYFIFFLIFAFTQEH